MTDISAYSASLLARRLGPDGGILLHGGGNLGDLWPEHQRFREEVIMRFSNRPIIQLPQSVCFLNRDALQRARKIFNAHPRLTLLIRDSHSLQIAGNEFRTTNLLCPDAALALRNLRPYGKPHVDVLWLRRMDHESTAAAVPTWPREWMVMDWASEPPALPGATRRLLRRMNRWRGTAVSEGSLIGHVYDLLARQRVDFGRRLLSQARVVVTDRLHGHVFSLLLAIPHVILSDRYNKIKSFYETWSRGLGLASFAESPAAAIEIARARLLDQQPASAG